MIDQLRLMLCAAGIDTHHRQATDFCNGYLDGNGWSADIELHGVFSLWQVGNVTRSWRHEGRFTDAESAFLKILEIVNA